MAVLYVKLQVECVKLHKELVKDPGEAVKQIS